jgi:chromosome segregation ATPase
MGTSPTVSSPGSPSGGLDPDQTDQLPALDVKAFEAERGIDPDDPLSSTDTWHVQVPDVAAADRAAVEHALAGSPTDAADESGGVFETIRTLEATLRAKSGHMANLEESLARAERERAVAERRLRERDQAVTRLESELETRAGTISQLESRLATQGDSARGSERQLRALEKERSELTGRITDLEESSTGLRADLDARGATIAKLKSDLTSRADQVRQLEQRRDALEIEKLALDETVRAREARIAFLESEIQNRAAQVSQLEDATHSRDAAGRKLQGEIEHLHGESAALKHELGARDARIGELTTQLAQKEAARLEMSGALEQRSARVADVEAQLRDRLAQVHRLHEALQGHAIRQRYHDEAMFEFEAEIGLQSRNIVELETGLERSRHEVTALKTALGERDAAISILEGEVAARDASLAQRADEIQRLRATTEDSGGAISTLEQKLASATADAAGLRTTIAEHETTIAELRGENTRHREELAVRSNSVQELGVTVDELQRRLVESAVEMKALVAKLDSERARVQVLESELAARGSQILSLEAQQRVQAELSTAQQHEIDNWKEQWAEVAATMGERESRLAILESEFKVKAAEAAARNERVTTLQKTIEDGAETIAQLEQELRNKSDAMVRVEGDLRVAEDAMLRLESQLRQKNEQLSSLQRSMDEHRTQVRHLQDTLLSRDTAIARLEGEIKASNEIIGSIQRDIRRLTGNQGGGNEMATPADGAQTPLPAGVAATGAASQPDSLTRLLVRLDGDTEVVHVLSKRTISIGRTDDNDVAIDTKYISRHHARILSGPNYTVLEDLGSTNGVFVNSRRVTRRHALNDGDVVMIGKTRFRFAVRQIDRPG